MSDDDKELLGYYGDQLEIIREINKRLEVDLNIERDINKLNGRLLGIIVCLVISMALWIATG